MMRIFRAHQFVKGISHCDRPKTASANGINRAIRVRAMEEFAHHQHRFAPIRPEFKVLRGLRLLLTPMTKQLIRQSFESHARYSPFIRQQFLHRRDHAGERLRRGDKFIREW
ncbi:MAG TPA: hypothetical protein VI320_38720 [Terracidiphilus sp.]